MANIQFFIVRLVTVGHYLDSAPSQTIYPSTVPLGKQCSVCSSLLCHCAKRLKSWVNSVHSRVALFTGNCEWHLFGGGLAGNLIPFPCLMAASVCAQVISVVSLCLPCNQIACPFYACIDEMAGNGIFFFYWEKKNFCCCSATAA